MAQSNCPLNWSVYKTKNKRGGETPWSESARKLLRPSYRRLSAKLLPTFAGRGCDVVCVTDPYGRILGFLDRSRYFIFQVALELYSRGWVGPVPDPLLLRKSGSAGNLTRTSGSLARNSTTRPQRRSIVVTGLIEPRSRPTTSQKIW
jgi:hypothetical protein